MCRKFQSLGNILIMVSPILLVWFLAPGSVFCNNFWRNQWGHANHYYKNSSSLILPESKGTPFNNIFLCVITFFKNCIYLSKTLWISLYLNKCDCTWMLSVNVRTFMLCCMQKDMWLFLLSHLIWLSQLNLLFCL